MDSPYGNLKQRLIKIRTRKDKKIDLERLLQVLEKEIGFEPVTEVTLEMRGRLARRDGKLHFEVAETGQRFEAQPVSGTAEGLAENQLLEVVAALADPRSFDRIAIKQCKAATATAGPAGQEQPVRTSATAELVVSGMT